MELTEELCTKFRTPDEQTKLLNDIDNNFRKEARNNKKILEEFRPFALFCDWKFGGRTDVECALLEGTQQVDGIVREKATGLKHNVEITWPKDGIEMKKIIEQINKGHSYSKDCGGYNDTTLQNKIVQRTLSIADKKAIRNYKEDGGSTLVIVFSSGFFFTSDNDHMRILNEMVENLEKKNYLADNVILFDINEKEFIIIKSDTKQRF